MTSDQPAAHEPAPESPPRDSGSTSTGMSGESLVMVAGAIVVLVWVFFGLIADQWFPPFVTGVVAVFAVIVPLARVTSVGTISAATLMKLIGYWLALAGALDFIDTLRFGWGGFADLIAALLLAASAVIAFLGVRSIEA